MLLLCYAAVLINLTYYAQHYAHVKVLCLGIQYFAIKIRLLLEYIHLYKAKINMITVLLEYIDL